MGARWVAVSIGFLALAVALVLHERDTKLQLDNLSTQLSSMSTRMDVLEKDLGEAQSQAEDAFNRAASVEYPQKR
jgi:hypothetical protein